MADNQKQSVARELGSMAGSLAIKSRGAAIAKAANYASTPVQFQTNELSKKFNIDPNEVVQQNINKDSKFIPQSMLKGLTGRASAYAMSQGDYFGGITFLAEGVRTSAFYFDPASGAKGKGVLINTHPGITLKYQTDTEIRKMFGGTSISNMTEEILSGVKRGQMSSNMKQAELRVGDYYQMFKQVQDKYSAGANNALLGMMDKNTHAKAMMATGKSKQEVLREVKENLPVTSYAVLQHLSYKYGPGGIKKFTNLLNHSISAGLDVANQESHLERGAKNIVYHYRDKNNTLHQDTRAMDIHRLFYTAGVKFSPSLNLKIATNSDLNPNEERLVNQVANKAGLGNISKNGKLDFPDGTARNSETDNLKLDFDRANKGLNNVNQNFKPISAALDKSSPMNNASAPPKPKKSEPPPCVSVTCMLR